MPLLPVHRQKSAAGFSLIEFAMVMLVSGLVFAAAMSLYVVHAKRMKIENTYTRIFNANTLMTEAWNLENFYPCPADPFLKPGDPEFGKAQCPPPSVLPGTCTNGATGVCVGEGVSSDLANNQVLIGMYPYVTVADKYDKMRGAMQIAYETATDPGTKASLKRTLEAANKSRIARAADMAFDGWDNQFTYVVTREHTRVLADNQRIAGAVEVRNAASNKDTRGGIHFAIISHGQNGKTAFNRYYSRSMECNDPRVTDLERENCNNDGILMRPAVVNHGTSNQEADDIIVYNNYVAQTLWKVVPCESGGGPGALEFCIRNTNPGNVGIGPEGADIKQKLTIDGQLRAEKVITNQICDANGNNCFSPSYIGGTAFQSCDQSGLSPNQRRVAVQIANRQFRCDVITLPGYNSTCPPQHIVAGFNSGGLICVDTCEDGQRRTATAPCPSGQTGQIDYETTFDCDMIPPAWTPWQVTNNCVAPPSATCYSTVEVSFSTDCTPMGTGGAQEFTTASCPAGQGSPTNFIDRSSSCMTFGEAQDVGRASCSATCVP